MTYFSFWPSASTITWLPTSTRSCLVFSSMICAFLIICSSVMIRPSRKASRPPALRATYAGDRLYIRRAAAATLRRRLLGWYDRSGRELPWRRTSDEYAVLVSEVMLQQTQVSRVLPAYPAFLRRFPTLA